MSCCSKPDSHIGHILYDEVEEAKENKGKEVQGTEFSTHDNVLVYPEATILWVFALGPDSLAKSVESTDEDVPKSKIEHTLETGCFLGYS